MGETAVQPGPPAGDDLVCFIIGPIGDKLSDAGTEARRSYEDAILTLENVIEPACHEVGIATIIRADTHTVAGEISEQIFRHLRDADVVIADLARPVRTRAVRLTKAIDQMLKTLNAFERWGQQSQQLLELVRTRSEKVENGEDHSPL